MSTTVYLQTYPAPPLSKKEILRYANSNKSAIIEQRIDELAEECKHLLSYKICYCRLPVRFHDDGIDLQFAKCKSDDLSKNLKGCNEIILFCATIGLPFDRLLSKYSRLSPADALILQAIGTERIESLAAAFEADLRALLKNENLLPRPRFSPGYGDLPLTLQSAIINTLNCPKNIGVTLNQQFLMTPSKSITAIIGLEEIQ